MTIIKNFFDAHFHIIDPKFPMNKNNGFLPAPFVVEQYQRATEKYEIIGGAIVSGSFQGYDQKYLINALNLLGKNFVGVTNLPYETSDDEIKELYGNGIRAVRFNLYRGGSESYLKLLPFAERLYDLCGMHVELYISGEQIEQHYQLLEKLPKFSIDHLGLTQIGQEKLLKLVERGAYVKATGFMRVNFNVATLLKKINKINPAALLFGTDLPGTRAKRQFQENDYDLICHLFDEKQQSNIFYKNAQRLYGVI